MVPFMVCQASLYSGFSIASQKLSHWFAASAHTVMYLPSEHLYHVKCAFGVMWPWLPELFSRPVCSAAVIPRPWSIVIAPSWLHSMCWPTP